MGGGHGPQFMVPKVSGAHAVARWGKTIGHGKLTLAAIGVSVFGSWVLQRALIGTLGWRCAVDGCVVCCVGVCGGGPRPHGRTRPLLARRQLFHVLSLFLRCGKRLSLRAIGVAVHRRARGTEGGPSS